MILKNNRAIITASFAALITLSLYLRVVGYEFVNFDDYQTIVNNPAIKILDGEFIREAFQTFYMGAWTPLVWLSYAVDYYFWGLNPAGYHLTNILLHALNAALIVLIADAVLKGMGVRDDAKKGLIYPAILLLAGLFWSIHPMRVESVAWLSERKDVLNGIFSLSSIYFYLCYVAELDPLSSKKSALWMYLLCTTFFILSLMAKPVSVVIPAMLLVMDWFPLNRFRNGNLKQVLIEKIPFLATSAIVSIATILGAPSGGSNSIPYEVFPFFDRVLLAGNALFEYCSMTLYPVGMTFLYLLPQHFPASYLFKTLAAALFTCFALFSYRKFPWLAATWVLFILPLTPVLGFFQNSSESFAPHYTYLGSAVPCITSAGIINFLYKKYSSPSFTQLKNLIILVTLLMLLFFGITTHRLIATWQNSETLWSRQISILPVGRAYSMRADYYMDNAKYLEAAEDFLKAINIANEVGFPGVHNLYALRGNALSKAGYYRDAVQAFSTAIRLNYQPNYFYHRGLALKALGKSREAEEDFVRAGNDTGELIWRGLK